MSTRRLAGRLALACALLVLVFSSSARAGGPPWISVEMPGDPTNRLSRGAVMLVHAYSCGGPTDARVTGRAEGIVNGERRTIDLSLVPAGSTGVYAVKQQWPSDGTWVLSFDMNIGGQVSTLVTLGPNGGVEPSEYYKQPSSVVRAAAIQVLSHKATTEEVDLLLRAGGPAAPALPANGATRAPLGYIAGGLGAVLVAGCLLFVVGPGRRNRR